MTPHRTEHWQRRKPAAQGAGVVVAQAAAAAEAGAALLAAGGSAADAAVGTALALAVVEPWNSGLGGIGFAQVLRPDGAAETIDFGPVAPRQLDPKAFPLTGRMTTDLFAWPEVLEDRNIHGPLAAAVPSAVAGYALLHARHGRLPLRDVLAPAIELAKRGLAADWWTTLKIAGAAAGLRRYAHAAALFLPDGLPPAPPYHGPPRFLALPELTATLERLRDAGFEDFYRGELAAGLVRDIHEAGGIIDAGDLADCAARVVPTLAVEAYGRTLHLAAGLTAGPTFAAVLAAMRDVPMGAAPDAAWFAALARSLRGAYADRLANAGATEPERAASCTTHISVADSAGGMVAMTTTLMSSFGNRVRLPRSGVLLNNGIMWFDPRPGTPNGLAPGKRPLCNMCPVVATRDGAPEFAVGASGGRRILAATYQLLAFAAGFGMGVEDAAHQPRIDVSGPDAIAADARFGPEVFAALAEAGPVETLENAASPLNFAAPNLVQRLPGGACIAISDAASPASLAVAA